MRGSSGTHCASSGAVGSLCLWCRWYRTELKQAILRRETKWIEKEELVKLVRTPCFARLGIASTAWLPSACSVSPIDSCALGGLQVDWKLTRGKWRPKLLDYAKQHTERVVKDTSGAAFKLAGVPRSASCAIVLRQRRLRITACLVITTT